jgi:ACAD9/ACADV-like protein/acyl-CoA dehydrogenase-like protein
LFIAREMLDTHLKVSAPALNSQLPLSQRLRTAAKAALFYLGWYPKQWLPFLEWFATQRSNARYRAVPALRKHQRYAGRTSRKLARSIFHALLRHGPKLEREQLLLGRFVDIGAELFAIAATCARAEQMLNNDNQKPGHLIELVDFFCQSAQLRIEEKFRQVRTNVDRSSYKVSQRILAEK